MFAEQIAYAYNFLSKALHAFENIIKITVRLLQMKWNWEYWIKSFYKFSVKTQDVRCKLVEFFHKLDLIQFICIMTEDFNWYYEIIYCKKYVTFAQLMLNMCSKDDFVFNIPNTFLSILVHAVNKTPQLFC